MMLANVLTSAMVFSALPFIPVWMANVCQSVTIRDAKQVINATVASVHPSLATAAQPPNAKARKSATLTDV